MRLDLLALAQEEWLDLEKALQVANAEDETTLLVTADRQFRPR